MGHPQIPTSAPHLYSQAVQLKLYQSFIFSIPILFSIILFLLFYLFYLKRRSYTSSSPSATLPTTLNQQPPPFHLCEIGVKGNLREKLLLVLFDEELRKKDSQCCVCLGEFEMEEELHQIPSCRHVFHIDCISHWLHSNSTCPLCRGSVINSTKETHLNPQTGPDTVPRPDHNPQIISPQQQQQFPVLVGIDSNLANCSREEHRVVVLIEGSSSTQHVVM